ncbi:MFS transporter [Oceanicoccus sp. KOV_DT_Chl]|uniref:MFS transporter n=1 Tax=Oceanicoccus sp. KOV_DT_Chl TaxID=1904639 RepID=UPI001F419FC5|nr:MFS transporter [Oceanicoccus sp. KOV_DT_Chl]
MAFFQNAMIITAVFVPLMQRHGLSMAEVLQTQAWFALIIAICEVPSGYLADCWGRKNTIQVGALLCLLAFGWLIHADSFADFVIYEIIMALGISLNSGADLALLYDSQSWLNRSKKIQYHGDNSQHITRLVSIEGFAGGFAALLAGLLTLWSLDWVLWAQAFISVLALWFALNLVEVPKIITQHNHSENFGKVKKALMQDPLVWWTAIAIIIFSLSALLTFWLYQKYWELQGIPLHWFGYLWATHCLVRALSARYACDIEQWLGARNVFIIIALLPIIGLIAMGSIGGWLGLALGLTVPLSRGLSLVVFYDALNKRLDAEFRATVNSLVSLGVRGLFIISGPILGLLVDYQGVQQSLLWLALIFLPLFCLVLIKLLTHIRQQPVTDITESAVLAEQ